MPCFGDGLVKFCEGEVWEGVRNEVGRFPPSSVLG